MRLITKQEGFALKYARQKELAEYSDKYQLHCGGACAHYGKIPKGCASCLFSDVYANGSFLGYTFNLPNACNANCKHCFTPLGDKPHERTCNPNFKLPDGWSNIVDAELLNGSMSPINEIVKSSNNKNPVALISFSGEGSEPLLYYPVIEKVVKHYKENVEPYIDKPITYKLYTNGKLLTEEMIEKLVNIGINEVRINSSAFNFHDIIIENMRNACKAFPVVTSELGLFPKYYDDIYRLMPVWDEMGLTHLSLCQPKYKDKNVFKQNIDLFPKDAVCYPASNDWLMVDDGGEAEKMIKYAIDTNISFSIIDCNCFVMNQEDGGNGISKQLNYLDFNDVIEMNV
jgi:hypothetical protein